MANKCFECRHWCALNEQIGECRRHAPADVWPVTSADEWCGDFDTRDYVCFYCWNAALDDSQ